MNLHKHLIKRTSFTVEIVGDDMEFNQINEFVATMTSKRMGVNIGENKLPMKLDPSKHIPFLEKALDDIQAQEDKEGRNFTEEPEIMSVPERSLLIQDGITDKKVRVITFLAITKHQEDEYFSSIRGYLPDDPTLTSAFIQSVFGTLRALESP